MSIVLSGDLAPGRAADVAKSQSSAIKYFPAFDYLRFVISLLVLTGHAGLIRGHDVGVDSVQIFFALSGWLIGGILLRTKPSDLPRFYFNRAARIWIPYGFSILLLAAASLLKDRVTGVWVETFFYNLTFVYNLFITPHIDALIPVLPLKGTGNHVWSLCAEEQFYLLAPFALMIPVFGRRLEFWCLLSCAVLLSPAWFFFGSICLGVTAAIAVKRFGDWQTSRSARIVTASIAVLGAFAILFDLAPHRLVAPFSSIAIVLFFAQRGTSSRVGSFLGGMSYQLYLNQWIGAFIAHAVFAKFGMRDSLASGIASLFIAIAIAAILYVVIDLNIKKYRDSFYSAARSRVIAALGFVLVFVGSVVGIYLTA